MNKFNKNHVQIGIIAFLTVCACILFYFILFNGDRFFTFGRGVIKLLSPFIYGTFIAYILNPVMKFVERKIIVPIYEKFRNPAKKYKKRAIRTLSVVISLILFLLFLYALIIMIVPQVIESIESIIVRVPEYFDHVNSWFNRVISNNQDLAEILTPYTADFERWVMENVLPSLQGVITNASTNIIGGVYSTIVTLTNIILGLIISVFLLSNKETYLAQAKKISYAVLREERANNLINNARFTHKTFGGFLSGKIIDSLIIGIICFVVISLFRIPYAVLISVIVGVTNVIPYFGPFLGAIPSIIILFMVDPMKALTFGIIVIILQQVDGNIIGPKILGDSTGLNSLWVIFAITVFGGIFGVFGMFIGVPVFAVIYAAIKTFVEERLKRKQLPYETTYYMQSDYHSDDVVKNTGKEIKFVKKTFEHIYVEGKGTQVKVVIQPDDSESKSDDISETTNITEEK